jgi:predicted metal-dependent enzyme (double-stranded beta helix superfamily)
VRLTELLEQLRTRVEKAGGGQADALAVLEEATKDPGELLSDLEPQDRVVSRPLHSSPALSVYLIVWAPGFVDPPHDHRLWVAVGVLAGEEGNFLYRPGPGGLELIDEVVVTAEETLTLAPAQVHGVRNTGDSFAVTIHVYGGDIATTPRSSWDPLTGQEHGYDMDLEQEVIERFNARQSGEAHPWDRTAAPGQLMAIRRELAQEGRVHA